MENPWGLTQKECTTLVLLVDGMANKTIAHTMAVAEGTVNTYLRRAYAKMGVSNRVAAALKWDRHFSR